MELNNIALINYTASGGGAGRICSILHQSFANSYLYNKFETNIEDRIIKVDNFSYRNKFYKLCKVLLDKSLHYKISFLPKFFNFLLRNVSEPLRTTKALLGNEDFCFPGTSQPTNYFVKEPTLVHAHNLFPDYFDFYSLPLLSKKYPLLITAHDCWLMTGHCAHPLSCTRFSIGCGNCPDLSIPPAITRDRTKQNLQTKIKILKSSKVYLATPCKWLKEMFLNSNVGALFEEIRIIPNGVKTDVFFPISDKNSLRKKHGLREDSIIYCFVGNKIKNNPWKNFELMQKSLQLFAEKHQQEVIFLCIGDNCETIRRQNFSCKFISHVEDQTLLNELYNCSDFYFHLAKADTFPNTILEAQSCGLPVFANPICGISEQIDEGVTGWFLKDSKPEMIAEKMFLHLKTCDYSKMQKDCRNHIIKSFSSEKMISLYNSYYMDILDSRSSRPKNFNN